MTTIPLRGAQGSRVLRRTTDRVMQGVRTSRYALQHVDRLAHEKAAVHEAGVEFHAVDVLYQQPLHGDGIGGRRRLW
jgi:hypothetical protein